MKNKRILVTGAGGPPGVNFINSLRYSGERMYIVGTDVEKMHLEWPDLDKAYHCPMPNTDPRYIPWLNKLIKKEKIEFVHGQPDSEVTVLSKNRDLIKSKTLFPDQRTIEICQDKFLSSLCWKEAGIHTIETFSIDNNNDIEEAGKKLKYPFWMRARVGAGARGASKIDSYAMGVYWFNYWKERNLGWEFIAQKYLPGRDYAFQSIWKDGELVTSCVRQRDELIYAFLAVSKKTGTPTIAHTVHRNDINDVATRAIKAVALDSTGVFCVDLTEDENGKPIVTEINAGRFFTTSFFFTKAGCNMPYYYIKMAYGEPLPKLKQYNALPENLYWCRHLDSPTCLIKNNKWKAQKL